MANPYWDGKVHKAVKFGTDSTRAPLKAGRELRKERLASGEPGPSWSYYGPKSNAGVPGERFSDGSGVSESGSINSGESFLKLPAALLPHRPAKKLDYVFRGIDRQRFSLPLL
jgi:hypothetical protein